NCVRTFRRGRETRGARWGRETRAERCCAERRKPPLADLLHEIAPPLRREEHYGSGPLNYPSFSPEKPAHFGRAGSKAVRPLRGNLRFGKSGQQGKGLMKPGGKQRTWPVSFKVQTKELPNACLAQFPDPGVADETNACW